MKIKTLLLALVLQSPLTALAQDFSPPPLAHAEVYRSSIKEAKSVQVFEGLPHQLHEKELLAKEVAKSKLVEDVTEEGLTKYAGFHFYTPSVAAKDPQKLIDLLSEKSSLKVYGGLKRCGAFHPDYCVSWKKEKMTYYALICYGCGELVFFDGKKRLIYDMTPVTLDKFKAIFKPYELKRPPNPQAKASDNKEACEDNKAATQ